MTNGREEKYLKYFSIDLSSIVSYVPQNSLCIWSPERVVEMITVFFLATHCRWSTTSMMIVFFNCNLFNINKLICISNYNKGWTAITVCIKCQDYTAIFDDIYMIICDYINILSQFGSLVYLIVVKAQLCKFNSLEKGLGFL